MIIRRQLNPGELMCGRFLWRYIGGKLDVFKWTGRNDYVALCEPEYISFGGGWVLFRSMMFERTPDRL